MPPLPARRHSYPRQKKTIPCQPYRRGPWQVWMRPPSTADTAPPSSRANLSAAFLSARLLAQPPAAGGHGSVVFGQEHYWSSPAAACPIVSEPVLAPEAQPSPARLLAQKTRVQTPLDARRSRGLHRGGPGTCTLHTPSAPLLHRPSYRGTSTSCRDPSPATCTRRAAAWSSTPRTKPGRTAPRRRSRGRCA